MIGRGVKEKDSSRKGRLLKVKRKGGGDSEGRAGNSS